MSQKDIHSNGTATVPTGFEPLIVSSSYIATIGPFFRCVGAGGVVLGIRIEQRHCNSGGNCHGGMLATFADLLLISAAHNLPEIASAGRLTPTVSLQLDYLAPARLGDWVEGRAEVLRPTRSIVFVQGLLCVGDETVVRTSGVIKLARTMGSRSDGPFAAEPPGALKSSR